MPKTGDYYIVELQAAHIKWGTLSHVGPRVRDPLEVYIPIPSSEAYNLNILQGQVYNAVSRDGSYNHPLRASGSQHHREFAKQFESDGRLTILGRWLKTRCNAKPGDEIEVRWTSNLDIILTHIPRP